MTLELEVEFNRMTDTSVYEGACETVLRSVCGAGLHREKPDHARYQ